MDPIHQSPGRLLTDNYLPLVQQKTDQGGGNTLLAVCIASAVILILVLLVIFSVCTCFLRSSNLSSDNQQHSAISNTRSREPTRPAELELVSLPVFIYGEQTTTSTSTSSSSSSSAWSDGNCVICLEDFVDGESIRVMPMPVCRHMFHKDCIDHWPALRASNCPVCRDQIIDKKNAEPAGSGGPNPNPADVTEPFTIVQQRQDIQLNVKSLESACFINGRKEIFDQQEDSWRNAFH